MFNIYLSHILILNKYFDVFYGKKYNVWYKIEKYVNTQIQIENILNIYSYIINNQNTKSVLN